jgi:hypothetical protein
MIAVNPWMLATFAFVVAAVSGYLVGRAHQDAANEREADPLEPAQFRQHPGARAVVDALEEAREQFECATSPADIRTQHFAGEWFYAAELCTRVIALLGGRKSEGLNDGEAFERLREGWYLEHTGGVVYRFRDELVEYWAGDGWSESCHGVPTGFGPWRIVPSPERREVARG